MKSLLILLLFIFNVDANTINVAMASNMSHISKELIKIFNKKYPNIKINTIISSSGKLTSQIKSNAPYDIFICANMRYSKYLYEHNLTITKPKIYAKGKISILSSKKQNFEDIKSLLKSNNIKKIAIANSKTAPYGQASKEFLTHLGIYKDIKDKFIYGESIGQTLLYTLNGVDIGFVATSSLYSNSLKKYKKDINYIDIPIKYYTPINQTIVILKNAISNKDAKLFYDFILSNQAKKIFDKYGYITSSKQDINLDTSMIKDYKILKKYYKDRYGVVYLNFRSYQYKNSNYYLMLNLNNLNTKIINKKDIGFMSITNKPKNTLFDKLKEVVSLHKNSLKNVGIKSSKNQTINGYYLTIDMCPSSKKSFEKDFFNSLKRKNKVPISIAITYNWVKYHKDDFLWLLNNKKYFDITWINHSKTHYYNIKNKNLATNFMLNDIKSFDDEIIVVEKMLLINNQIPSIWFRFPGLISKKYLINRLINKYSLIPLGASNWLAKTKKYISNGDVVLVHGNLNEHKGIIIFNKLPNKNKQLLSLNNIYN